ncbi:MAG: response regulator [Pseudomonadales bacterium]|nr:response regulator [Pseudomonadales bacterium]
MKLHEILDQQVKELLPEELANHPGLEKLLDAVDATYHEYESDLVLLEQHMVRNSDELLELNSKLQTQSDKQKLALTRLKESIHELNADAESKIMDDDDVASLSRFLAQEIRQRQHTESELIKAKDIAESAARAKSEFLATMSHEIRTPLNGVIGMASLLENTKLTKSQERYLDTIQSCCQSLMNLINDILDYSKFDAGKLHLERTAFSPRAAIEQTCQVVAERAHAKNIELIGFTDPRVPETLMGDPGRIHQILLNLLSNAVKFTEAGEISVKAFPGRSTPGSKHRYWLTFVIKDSGIGIPKKDLKRIFEPFEQADSTTTRKYGGTGLGLAVCKQFTDAMGGKIDIKSRLGKGSEFIVTIPFRNIAQSQEPIWTSQPLPKKRVMLIDDNRTSSDALEETLEHWGLSIYPVAKPENAIRLLKKGKFDAAILDRNIPNTDTSVLVEKIRLLGKNFEDFPILMLINLVEKHIVEEQHDANMDYVTKPIESEVLYQRLSELLSSTRKKKVKRKAKKENNSWQPARELKVLVVEDDLVNQEIAAMMLKDLHCNVDIARNGIEAVAAVNRMNYDLVFMDCQMPEMDGYTATQHIREQGLSELPIVALTANVMPEDKAKCLKSGMNDYLSKPVRPPSLRGILQKWTLEKINPEEIAKPLSIEETSAAIESLEDTDKIPDMIPGINLRQGLEMMGGKLSRYRKLLYLAMDQHRYTYDKIREAIESGDYQEAQKLAHSLKSVAANIGAASLSSTAFSIEKQLRELKENDSIPGNLLQELDLQWKQVRSSILSLSKDGRK